MPLALIVHGGAWDIPDNEVDAHIAGCRAALDAGWSVLLAGGTSLDAVEAAVRVLEDDEAFDAGVGSVLNRDGDVELDASIMDGATLRSGAVAAVRRIANPVSLARQILGSDSVLLVSEGAERFAVARGIPLIANEALIVPRERDRWRELLGSEDHTMADGFRRPPGEVAGARGLISGPGDTVGAAALDSFGNIAAATSTGGITMKPAGRVGDVPMIGAGLYADNLTAACSCTGWGESIIKVLLGKTATDLVGNGQTPQGAARSAIGTLSERVGGLGGCILVDRHGRIGYAFNTPRMAYAFRREGGDEGAGV